MVVLENIHQTEFQKLFQYPCMYCGECNIWQNAFEVPELDTLENVVSACRKKKCQCIGTIVQRWEVENNDELLQLYDTLIAKERGRNK